MDQRFTVQIAVPYRYEVCFTSRVFDTGNRTLVRAFSGREPDKRHRILFVLDEGVARAWPTLVESIRTYTEHHSETLTLAGDPVVVPGGEQVKNDPNCTLGLHAEIARRGLDRQSYCAIIGGGAVQDMAGFAAATAHRGLRVVRLPTTVLSQNDSGVGVKNGINAFGMKNFVGTFAPPFAVVSDLDFLETLEHRDRIAGMAEAVKVSLIRDRVFFEWLCRNVSQLRDFEAGATRHMIERSAELHLRHIEGSGDPFEFGSARPLDFGHWAAHKLESLTEHRLRHGEAVAIGLALDTRYSVEAGLLDHASADRILTLLSSLGLPTFDPELLATDGSGKLVILEGLREFQEHLGGELTITLLEGPGSPVERHAMDSALILRAVRWLEQGQASREFANSGAAE
jgi:3-dehydroquinate synthase